MANPYRQLIERVVRFYPPVTADVLDAMVRVESNCDPTARSASDARGLTQIIPRIHAATLGRKVADEMGVELTDETWYDPEFSLRAGARHLAWLYTSDPQPSWERAVRAYHSGSYAPPSDFVDGQGTGSDQHIAKFRAALAAVQAEQQGVAHMGMKAYRFPGMATDVWLPDWIRVTIDIVDHPNVTNNQKSTRQTRTTWHDTGNSATNAAGEYRWLKNGRPGGEAGGYNAIFDDREIYITGRFDQVTWHAGTAEGNATSYGIEQAWGGAVNFEKSLEVGAALHGGIIAARGWNAADNLVQHNFWYGKNCPGQIRRRGIWPRVLQMTQEAADRARAAGGGEATAPAVQYPQPLKIAVLDDAGEAWRGYAEFEQDGVRYRAFPMPMRAKAMRDTPRRRFPDLGREEAVGPALPAGTEFDVAFAVQRMDQPDAVPVARTPWGTFVSLFDLAVIGD